jgi:hypothetical protein
LTVFWSARIAGAGSGLLVVGDEESHPEEPSTTKIKRPNASVKRGDICPSHSVKCGTGPKPVNVPSFIEQVRPPIRDTRV